MQLQVTNLSLAIGSKPLIRHLDWRVNPGECWCIIGRNGAGKTTLLRSLAGLNELPRDAGDIAINCQRLRNWSLLELAKVRSYLAQGRNDVFAYPVIETVMAARHPYNDGNYWESSEDVAMAQAALAELDVADLAHRDVRSLSGGERQRVAIAALLAQDAELMLLDEPTNSLDLAHQVSVMQLFSERCTKQKKSVLVVSHDLNLAYGIATHALLMMDDGKWITGRVAEVMNAANLSRCLGYPIEQIQHGDRTLFLPLHSIS